MAPPFVLADLDTAAGTFGQGYPDGALACGLDRRTRLQSTYLTWDVGSPHDVTMWYFQLTYWTDNWGQVRITNYAFRSSENGGVNRSPESLLSSATRF